MEDRKRTILAVIIVVVVLAAVLYSFSLTLFIRHQAPEVPDPNASTGQEQASADPQAGGIPVEGTLEDGICVGLGTDGAAHGGVPEPI